MIMSDQDRQSRGTYDTYIENAEYVVQNWLHL